MSRLLLLDPLSLLGNEIRDALTARRDFWQEVRLASNDPEKVGTLTEVGGAAALVEAFEPSDGEWDLVVVCDEPLPRPEEIARLGAACTVLYAHGTSSVDETVPVVAGVNSARATLGGRVTSPPAPVVLLAHLLAPLRELGLERAAASVLLPASARGQEGLDELLDQTRGLLAFQDEIPRDVWGRQLAFNILPADADGASLSDALRSVLDHPGPLSVQPLQAGVFHGVMASVWVQLAEGTAADEVSEAISATPWVETPEESASVGPVAAGTSNQILLGGVRGDGAGGFWIWAVMDNLTRGGALNVAAIAEGLFAPSH